MDIDFVVNCYERTYRDVLRPGFVADLARQQGVSFASVTVLVNNVGDRGDAERIAKQLLTAPGSGVTRTLFVADEIGRALHLAGLKPRHIARLPHFSDCCLVAATIDGPDLLVYWDADATLDQPHNWITPSLAYLAGHPAVAIANPDNWHKGLAVREALCVDGAFAIGYGFSDVAFLARRSELRGRIYREFAPAAWRYPMAHIEPIFEQRVDGYMRRHRRLRATYLGAVVRHLDPAGLNYPTPGFRGRARRKAFHHLGRLASLSHHPAMRPWD